MNQPAARRPVHVLCGLLLLLALSRTSQSDSSEATASHPNLVILYADDLGYGDVQCYNPQRGKIPTPHIDRLAAQGMRFTDGHSSSGVCSPSRYALLTGRYHWRTRLQEGIVGRWGEPLIVPERLTLASFAKQHGYRTACIGKWHLGWDWPIPPEKAALFKAGPNGAAGPSAAQQAVWQEVFSRPIGGGPVARGFDSYFGTDIPNWPPFCFIENDRTRGIPSEFLPAHLLKINQANIQGPALKGWTLEPILPALADRAVDFITKAATAAEPFLLYVPFTAPHTPLAVNQEWKGKSGLGLYADLVMETDAVVGRILEALERSGAAEKTLVVFTSDNGCAPYIGIPEMERNGHFPSGPLRGYKTDAWEGGHRVPFIVRWPAVVKPGTTCGQLVHQADLVRTFAEILGSPLPDQAGEDSFSLLPLLKGGDKPIRENAMSASINGVPALRSGSWKYIPAPGSGGWTNHLGHLDRHAVPAPGSQPVQLYNLADDLGETKNLAAAMPEKVSEMQALLEKLIVEGRSTPGAPQKNDVEVIRYPRAPVPKKEAAAAPTVRKQPDLVVFLSDDHGQLDSVPYGSTEARTPAMQRLAERGMVFTHAFVASPSCAPSRTAMLTGLMPARNGAEANHTSKAKGIASLPDTLRALGYQTAAFGKVAHGQKATPHGFDLHVDPHDAAAVREFLTERRDRSKPLCLFVGTHRPHVPWMRIDGYAPAALTLPKTFIDTPETRDFRARYLTDVTDADRRLGEVLDLTDQHLSADRLFIYTSDHGAQWPFGKWNLYDAGIRVPLIVSWPGVVPPGTRTDAMVQWIDLLPTLIDAAGGAAPETIDGRSFLHVLRDPGARHRSEIFTTHSGDGKTNVYPIRSVRTPDWKLIWNLHPEFAYVSHIDQSFAADGGRYWLSWFDKAKTDPVAAAIVQLYHRRPEFELYDMRRDPLERANLADDPAHAETVAGLTRTLEAWMTAQGDRKTVFNQPRLLSDPNATVPGPDAGIDRSPRTKRPPSPSLPTSS